MIGETLTVATEAVEDVLRGFKKVTIKEDEKARVEVLRRMLRKAHNETSAKFMRTGNRQQIGLQALERYLMPASQWKDYRKRRRS
jgi:hypothetical protein